MNVEPTIRTIPGELAGQRLDRALAKLFPEYSRSRLKAWLLDGAIVVDGSSPRPRDPVHGGETVTLSAQPEVVVAAAPEPMTLDVVHEDDSVMVINKPAGLVVHPGAWQQQRHVDEWLVEPHAATRGYSARGHRSSAGQGYDGPATHREDIARAYCPGPVTGGSRYIASLPGRLQRRSDRWRHYRRSHWPTSH